MFLTAVSSAFGWTIFDFSRRRLGENIPAIPAVVCIMLAQTALCLPFGGYSALTTQDQRWYVVAALSVLVNAVANVMFVMGVQRAAFTLVVPLLSLTPAFAATIGWLVFDEALSFRQILAVAVVVGAALWLGFRGAGHRTTMREKSGMILMTITAFLWAVTPFLDRACMSADSTVPLAAYVGSQCLGVAIVLMVCTVLVPAFRQQFSGLWGRVRLHWPWVVAAAISASIGLYFQIVGIQTATHIGLFEAVKRSLTMLLSLALGRFLLKERLTRDRIMAAITMGLGIFLLA